MTYSYRIDTSADGAVWEATEHRGAISGDDAPRILAREPLERHDPDISDDLSMRVMIWDGPESEDCDTWARVDFHSRNRCPYEGDLHHVREAARGLSSAKFDVERLRRALADAELTRDKAEARLNREAVDAMNLEGCTRGDICDAADREYQWLGNLLKATDRR